MIYFQTRFVVVRTGHVPGTGAYSVLDTEQGDRVLFQGTLSECHRQAATFAELVHATRIAGFGARSSDSSDAGRRRMARRTGKPGGRFSFVHNGVTVSRATQGQILNLAQRRAEATDGEITLTIKEWEDVVATVKRLLDGAVVTYRV